MAGMTVNSGLCPGHIAVVLRGELDVTDAMRLARALSVPATSGSRVIVDLAGPACMDCSGPSPQVSACRQATSMGGDLELAAPQQPMAHLLSLTGLTGPLPVYASVAEAASAGGTAPAPGGPEQAGGEVDSVDGEASPAGPRYLVTGAMYD